MNNSLKKAYILRNIIMLGSVLLLGLVTIFNYNNYRYFVMGGICAFLLFFLSIRLLQKYTSYLYNTEGRLHEIADFLKWRKTITKGEKNMLFAIMIWLGEDDEIESYIQNNELSLQQSISFDFYNIDRKLFYLKEDNEYSQEINRVKQKVALYKTSPNHFKEVEERFDSNLKFYEQYLQEKYDDALETLNQIMVKEVLVEIWVKYHKMMIYEVQGLDEKADAIKTQFKEYRCNSRFHKWSAIECKKSKNVYSFSMRVLLLALLICLGIVIYKANEKYTDLKAAVKEEYNINVDESDMLYDYMSDDCGVRIYRSGKDIVYIYYTMDENNIDINKIYKDSYSRNNNDMVSWYASARVSSVSIGFYNGIPDSITDVIIAESDELDKSMVSEDEVKTIETITVKNETYYLIYMK